MHVDVLPLLMNTRSLAFGGVICALSSTCIIFSSLFHLIFPLVISCVFYYLCAKKCGNSCALIVVITSNIVGFLVGGVGGGEILFSVLLFSPYSILIYMTANFKKPWHFAIRGAVFAVFSAAIYLLFATVLKDLVGLNDYNFGLGVYAFGVVWTVILVLFGFALDSGCRIIARRFIKND